jgi:hypothetical protein
MSSVATLTTRRPARLRAIHGPRRHRARKHSAPALTNQSSITRVLGRIGSCKRAPASLASRGSAISGPYRSAEGGRTGLRAEPRRSDGCPQSPAIRGGARTESARRRSAVVLNAHPGTGTPAAQPARLASAVVLPRCATIVSTVRSVVLPVRRLVRATERSPWRTVAVPRGGIKELDTLAVSFNQMADPDGGTGPARQYHGQLDESRRAHARQRAPRRPRSADSLTEPPPVPRAAA